jgi:lysyl-tRNA synthetase class 2
MGREDQIVQERVKKLNELRKMGVNPYAHRFEKKDNSAAIKEKYAGLKEDERTKDSVRVAGRIMTIRDMGNLAFSTMQDGSGKVQIVLQKGETPEKTMEFFSKFVDSGDFIGVDGIVFKTRRGEISVLAKKIEILTKSILPLPEKWHGIVDEEERFRKRYLDMAVSPEVRKVFETRAKIIEVLRDFMKKHEFIEVETPLLQGCYGGACAKPFMTHCEAYNSALYLSIAPELYLKKALVGGFERVYEITKKFRNEGVDRMHNPEHMTIEWYQGYADYNDGMALFEELMKDVAIKMTGKTEIEYQGNKINFAKWKRLPLLDAIKEYLKEDVTKVKTDAEAKKIAQKHGIEKIEEVTRLNLPDELMKLFRDKIIQPTFLIDYPIEMCPLAKPSQKDPTKAEIFQPIVAGMELARAYSELNDPHLQEKSFLEQESERQRGNKEAMPTDTDFITALSHGMPPACGVGVGIERLVMLFTNQTTIRNVIMFPFMKPEMIKKDLKEVAMVEREEKKIETKEKSNKKTNKASSIKEIKKKEAKK